MKRLYKTRKRGTSKERYNITTIDVFFYSFASMIIAFLGLTNPDVNLKRMHQLYNQMIMITQNIDMPSLQYALFQDPALWHYMRRYMYFEK